MRDFSRRAFLRSGALCLAASSSAQLLAAEAAAKPLFRLGLMTDLHYADKESSKTRFYREALGKLDEAVAYFNEHRPARVVELGDLIDQADEVDQEIAWLKVIEERFARLAMPRHYVLGNHCVTTLTKEEFAAHTGLGSRPHTHFDEGGVRFIILDACYREDGAPYGRKNFSWQDANIPPAELEWLKARLTDAPGPVIVLAHQRLDLDAAHAVRNADAVRVVLEQSGKVLAVFQGHSHKNDYQQIAGIHYCTLVAMVEGSGLDNSGYALLDVMPDRSLRVHGFRRQVDRLFLRA
jgi:alkaline phosphatase